MNNTCFTFPSSAPGQAAWVADPSCRGTFGIALLCLSTTIVCIWSSVHRNIPLRRLSTIRSLIRDAPLVLVALFAPELLFYFALNQYLCSRNLVKIAEKKFDHHFTLKHGFYATMGGFAIKHVDDNGVETSPIKKLTHGGVTELMKRYPDSIPDLSLESITDREKSTNLGKALLIVQVLWFCLNCVSRLAEQLPLSLLEVTTLAHGLFTLLSYAMWWSKPLNIDAPTQVTLAPTYSVGIFGTTSDSVPKFSDLFSAPGFVTVGSRWRVVDFSVTTTISFVYDILHFLAFQARFPTRIERELWRVACVVVMSSGLLNITSIFLAMESQFSWSHRWSDAGSVLNLTAYRIIPFFYLLASGYLLVESIRQLWYLPREAYVVASWSYYIPHWL
ncbi:hypothetical protein SCHPADRAFT_827045 [Schizopora paradoxa]|uniref:Uncharacterized protein n=1 Tax=Schizopora paradoxa TaxID=27342 RepID=A0A0H2SAZ5_9AGAM|nr:hypothetical protein SCHPADRAFT_827045 [Schizopora paradoxa]